MKTTRLTEKRIRDYLSKGKRFDGRKPLEFRNLTIETGVSKNAEGSARVKLGNTEVLVGVKMSVVEPYADSPEKGNLMVTAELLPLSSPRYESGPPKIESIELARVIDRFVRESKFIDLEKLCIKKGEKVWSIFIDIYSINADGNLLDAGAIGAIAALKNAKIPEYDSKEEKVIYGKLTNKKVPLKSNIPLSITYYRVGDSWILDPTIEEEDTCETRITIGSASDDISSIQKGGSKELSVDAVEEVLDSIEKIYKNLYSKIEKNLK